MKKQVLLMVLVILAMLFFMRKTSGYLSGTAYDVSPYGDPPGTYCFSSSRCRNDCVNARCT